MKSRNPRILRSKLASAILIILLLTVGIISRAADYFTTNSDCLNHFWAAAESPRPVTVISFGDSMADSYRSPTCHLMNKLVTRLGIAGYSLQNYGNTLGVQVANGTAYIPPDTNWFVRYQSLPPGGANWWINLPFPEGNYCDQAGIFYVAQPQGGLWHLQISTNGGDWGTVLTVDGYSPSPTGRLASVTLSANRYRLRAEGVTGTNLIIGPYTLNTRTNGVHVVFTDWGGITLEMVSNVPRSIREPIFAALQPDLIVWHMKEAADLATSNYLAECEQWWSAAAPNADVLYLGTPWVSEDTNAAPGSYKTIEQNHMVRNAAITHRRAYVDLMQPTVSYEWLLANGYMADQTHLNSAGGLLCANILWDDLGFFALKLPRQINLYGSPDPLELSYQTDLRAVYRLETSADLQTWQPLLTNAPGSGLFTTNVNPNGTVFYRLGLTPP
ncbi:MAG TPA: hypothetical protein VFZ59_12655 [Verrucomicrobiae bacterium]|nr:hypothetical protein [Verrucomicrobiae bacterium]